MCTRNAAFAILSAIAFLSLPSEASAQTNFMNHIRGWLGFDQVVELGDPLPLIEPVMVQEVNLTEARFTPPLVVEHYLDTASSSQDHDWTTINDWLLSGLPAGTAHIDPSLDLTSLNVDRDQFLCLATNIYYEARGSTLNDQRAVALVTLNRTKHWRWRGSICDVVWERSQFSWTITSNRAGSRVRTAGSWQTAQLVAYEVLRGYVEDITQGATNYYNPSVVRPQWASLVVQSERIGAHRYVLLRTTQSYNPPQGSPAEPVERMYSNAIRSIMRQMRLAQS